MKIERRLSLPNIPVIDQVNWRIAEVRIANADGSERFRAEVEVPLQWSDTAAGILAQKYLRRAGVPQGALGGVETSGMPAWLWPRQSDPGIQCGGETSAKQVFHRMVGCWTYWAWREGLFFDPADRTGSTPNLPNLILRNQSEEYAKIFYDELYLMLALQIAAPNSPQWFNTGLHWAYGIEGPASGQWAVDWNEHTDAGRIKHIFETPNSYERPQPHACFLTPVTDDLVNPGGIMDCCVREARIFKHGSGSGVNVSTIRSKGEKLSGGGQASGVMSWLDIWDRAAGSIASGGTTRRAATIRILNIDHPEVHQFINWKVREETKAAAMWVGSQVFRNHYLFGSDKENEVYLSIPDAALDRMRHGFEPELFGIGWEGEAYRTVSGQNSNNSVRIPDEFMNKLDSEVDTWPLLERTTGKTSEIVSARGLWQEICRATWAAGDPGILFDTTINEWNTSAADGRINTTNPCSEFHHLDGSACNLASLNLLTFLDDGGNVFDVEAFDHAVRLWTMVLDISVHMASFPAREFALGAYNYRTLGLGYANLGAALMAQAIPYDSDAGRSFAANVTALLTGGAYRTSAEMASEVGPFPRYEANRDHMRRVLLNHALALTNEPFKGVTADPPRWAPMGFDELRDYADRVWAEALSLGAQHGYRNAQVSLIAPTGTISFVLDCFTRDTLVAVADGRGAVSFDQLASEGRDVDVYACDSEGQLVIKKMRNIRPIRASRIAEIILDDGSKVSCTREHLFMLRNGTYKRAIDLRVGDSLKRFDSELQDLDKQDIQRRAVRLSSKRFSSKGATWQYQYRLIGKRLYPEYECGVGLIHHKDGNPLNDHVDNLEHVDSVGEHWKRHWGMMSEAERKEVINRRMLSRDPAQALLQLEKARKLSHTPQARAKAKVTYPAEARSARMIESYKDISIERRQETAKRIWETRRKNDPTNETRWKTAAGNRSQRRSEDQLDNMRAGWQKRENKKPAAGLLWITNGDSCHRVRKDQPLPEGWWYGHNFNHKVVSIRERGIEVTYCGEVDDVRNFAIITSIKGDLSTGSLSGIIVHNCDTTGVEPDLALIKIKNLAGGGQLTITNQTVERALRKLNYPVEYARRIVELLAENGGDIQALPTDAYIRHEDLPVFDTANPPRSGGRYLAPMAHVLMVAAVQPFLSGAVSKTVNLPHDATPEDVDNVYRRAHKLGVKAIAPYRDGSKLSQPLSSAGNKKLVDTSDIPGAGEEWFKKARLVTPNKKEMYPELVRGDREPLPGRREGYTQKVRVEDQSIYLRTGEYPDGRLGEVFVTWSREGSTVRSLMECFAKAVSIGLQYGVPLPEFVDAFVHTKFEPAGIVTGHDEVKICSSVVDLIFRDAAVSYLGRQELAHNGSGNNATVGMAPPGNGGIAANTHEGPTPIVNGDTCPECGAMLEITGTCKSCRGCGYNTGCG